ncbi:8-oxo-dGTP diphosphatase [Glycomyces lechevalierae]|uniref:Oxidized purine nucleoside triphosphate hydrolase n=1 Tax=Glycomyces lechevalierae TaxID=256034 RepID=A0A9X3PH39_9ACTN|nr:NUDIX domain-containing protein [Glycomyces lechevalierae]MDA1385255.1 NUDIX domain-containing protein [Glycomyces lechevalierae]MDR7337128.1 8-oxo-dGTP diphosphatase [Glycomyces lechevalierae]
MTLTPMCPCLLTRHSPTGRREVLLGRKKTGFGTGKIVGLGGHVEPGETPLAATVREVAEESGIQVEPADLREAAALTFLFPAKPEWDMQVIVFVGDRFTGEARECDEIAPRWCPLDDLPVQDMWDDNQYWLLQVMDGPHLTATFEFAADGETVETSRIELGPTGIGDEG